MSAILVSGVPVQGLENSRVAQVNLSGKADRVVEPVAKIPVTGMIEDNRAQDDRSLQHQQRVVFCCKVVEQDSLGEERLLRGRAAAKAAGGE